MEPFCFVSLFSLLKFLPDELLEGFKKKQQRGNSDLEEHHIYTMKSAIKQCFTLRAVQRQINKVLWAGS